MYIYIHKRKQFSNKRVTSISLCFVVEIDSHGSTAAITSHRNPPYMFLNKTWAGNPAAVRTGSKNWLSWVIFCLLLCSEP